MRLGGFIRKNAKFVNEFMKKNYDKEADLDQGLKWAAEALQNNIDHPKKNSEIMVVNNQEIRFLKEEEIARLFDSIEEE